MKFRLWQVVGLGAGLAGCSAVPPSGIIDHKDTPLAVAPIDLGDAGSKPLLVPKVSLGLSSPTVGVTGSVYHWWSSGPRDLPSAVFAGVPYAAAARRTLREHHYRIGAHGYVLRSTITDAHYNVSWNGTDIDEERILHAAMTVAFQLVDAQTQRPVLARTFRAAVEDVRLTPIANAGTEAIALFRRDLDQLLSDPDFVALMRA